MEAPGNEDLEWMRIAPRLAAMPRQVPFAVPPAYFEGLENAVLDKTACTSIPGKSRTPFTVPEGYFEQLPSRIRERLHEETPPRARVIFLRPAFGLSAAAAFLAILLLTRPGRDAIPTSQEPLTVEEITASGFLDDVEESVILEALSRETTTDNSVPAIEEYLIENNIDIYLLTNEL